MVALNKKEKKVIKKVVDEMSKGGLFCGEYDAKNGDAQFMYGIATVMEYFAYLISEDYGEEFEKAFFKNLAKSKKSS